MRPKTLRQEQHVVSRRWNAQYVISTARTGGGVAHILDQRNSMLIWNADTRSYTWDIEVLCGYPFGWSRGSTFRLVRTNTRQYCQRCLKKRHSFASFDKAVRAVQKAATKAQSQNDLEAAKMLRRAASMGDYGRLLEVLEYWDQRGQS